MSSLRTVAVAGGTGRLGHHVVESLLSPPFRESFKEVVLLTRAKTPMSESLEQMGATVRYYSTDDMSTALKGVDVLVNTLSSKGHHFKLKILEALPSSSVKLYFPSEFGVDHYGHTFLQEQWDGKKQMYQRVKKEAPNIQICLVFIGLFMELSIGPWFGFNTKNGRYECIGSAKTPSSYTSLSDSGKIVAALASLPYSEIPEMTHFGGDTISCAGIAIAMTESGGPQIKIEEVELDRFKTKVLTNPGEMPADHIRFLMGEGKVDHRTTRMGNDSGLVNKGEKKWKWRNIADYAAEVKGRPFM